MRRMPRFQFGLRALLLAALVLPPIIAHQYRRWHDEDLWRSLAAAKERRDAALVAWRRTYDRYQNGVAAPAQEEAAQVQYYAGRQDVESALQAIKTRYGGTDKDLQRAMGARQKRKR